MNKPTPPPPPPARNPPRAALGRGLDALLRPASAATAPAPPASPARTSPDAPRAGVELANGDTVAWIDLAAIQPNPFQPRRHFDPEALAELAASIRAQGVLQPVLVRRQGSGFELVAGERRFRAAQMAGLQRIPALVRPFDDERSLAVALIENLQRSDLNPIEQAEAFQELGQRFRLTQEQIAAHTGKDRATVANCLRLLRLEAAVVEMLRQAQLTPGQARPLVGLTPELQATLAQRIRAEHWPARRVEEHVQRLQQPPPPPAPPAARDPNERDAELRLAQALGAKVELKPGRGQSGTISIRYASLEDFQRLFDRLLGTGG